MAVSPQEITRLLDECRAGSREAEERLAPLIYREMHRIAARLMSREKPGRTLQATALVNEAYLRLFRSSQLEWQNRVHFYAVAARLMRKLLIDAARARGAQKRGGGVKIPLEDADAAALPPEVDVLALNSALEQLAAIDPRAAQVVELRFFTGMEEKDIAEVLGVSVITVKRDWKAARAWLFAQLQPARAATAG